MEQLPSPYGFVPLSEHVWFPDWSGAPVHDWPFEDGISGSLTVQIEAKTPLYVRPAPAPGSSGKGQRKTPRSYAWDDGGHAIPGTSVKGMLRNVLEIATFGKMGRVNDHRYGLRDLSGPEEIYREFMARFDRAEVGGRSKPITLPLVSAGFLKRDEAAARNPRPDEDDQVVAWIHPSGFAKMHYRDILRRARENKNKSYEPGRRQSGPSKYRGWHGGGRELDRKVLDAQARELPRRLVHFDLEEHRSPNSLRPSQYGLARFRPEGQGRRGVLVFTGQPNAWREGEVRGRNQPKQHDFVFFDNPSRTQPIPVTRRLLRDFEFIHSDRGQQARQVGSHVPNEEWGFWKPAFEEDQWVPIFFLLHGKEETGPEVRRGSPLKAFGLAMMFRLAYEHTTEDAVRNAQPDFDRQELDFAETLLGTVGRSTRGAEARADTRKGRVRFGHFALEGAPRYAGEVRDVVLGAPKASYYPNYLEHGPGHGEAPAKGPNGKPRHMTFQDEGVRARGWKRYKHQQVWTPEAPKGGRGQKLDLSRVGTSFQPLEAGSTFEGTLHLHNVKRVELGALLWCLDFGQEQECFHGLGMGKPLGYGRVALRIKEARLEANQGDDVDLDACRREWQEQADAWLGERGEHCSWVDTPQIQELLALARPLEPGDRSGRYPLLRNRDRKNEFVLGKQKGLALAPAAGRQGRAAFVPKGKKRKDEGPGDFRRFTPSFGRGSQPSVSRSTPSRSKTGASSKSSAPKAFAGLKPGVEVKVRLVSQTRRGKWRVELLDGSGEGIVHTKEQPAGAQEGAELVAIFDAGGNPRDLNFRWK